MDRSPVNYEWTGRIRFVFHPGAALSPNRFWPAVDVGAFPNAENAAVGDLDGDGILVAEEMIRLNEEKQKEMKSFLTWLEAELKVEPDNKGNTGIEALTGKARLKNYLGDYQKGEPEVPFDELWKILQKNKSRIGRKLTHEFMAELREAYERSLAKRRPIKECLCLTDKLIDQIVYRLYGLTAEEIKIVEEGPGERK